MTITQQLKRNHVVRAFNIARKQIRKRPDIAQNIIMRFARSHHKQTDYINQLIKLAEETE